MKSDDERVAVIACNAILDRAFGKPKEQPAEPRKAQVPGVSHLSDNEPAQLRKLMEKLASAAIERGRADR